mmetsp:Transcript_38800/g.89943  ORF Transcript_38800/g.89943 Transcript_38800/m.89943 type:complete len:101 (-) Transcript_38800:39-341(-)
MWPQQTSCCWTSEQAAQPFTLSIEAVRCQVAGAQAEAFTRANGFASAPSLTGEGGGCTSNSPRVTTKAATRLAASVGTFGCGGALRVLRGSISRVPHQDD